MADNLRPSGTVSSTLVTAPGMGMFAGENYAGGQTLEMNRQPCAATWLGPALRSA
jgi:hypothetical protein